MRGVCRVWSVRVCVWGGGGVRVWGGAVWSVECGVWSVWVWGGGVE